jgi:hypothetical protein
VWGGEGRSDIVGHQCNAALPSGQGRAGQVSPVFGPWELGDPRSIIGIAAGGGERAPLTDPAQPTLGHGSSGEVIRRLQLSWEAPGAHSADAGGWTSPPPAGTGHTCESSNMGHRNIVSLSTYQSCHLKQRPASLGRLHISQNLCVQSLPA